MNNPADRFDANGRSTLHNRSVSNLVNVSFAGYATVATGGPVRVRVNWAVSVPDLPGRAGPGQLSGTLGVFEVNAVGDAFLLPANGSLSVDVSGFTDGFPNGNFPFTRTFSQGAPVLEFLSIGTTAADFSVNFVDGNTGLLTDFPAPCVVDGVAAECFVVLFDESGTGLDKALPNNSTSGATEPSFPITYSFTVLP